MKPAFQFKQFSVFDDKCGMKLSTDAVLLGAIAQPGNAAKILDIGTGCGILALMMAQKCDAAIDAVEIDRDAYLQAKQNFQNSKWAARLKIFNTSVQNFTETSAKKYDCIICNPPYFHGMLKSPYHNINSAKHNSTLDFHELSHCVRALLYEDGLFWAICPVSEKKRFLEAMSVSGLFCQKLFLISDKPGKVSNRFIACLSFQTPFITEYAEIMLKNHDGIPSETLREITKDFYLDF